MMQLLTGSVTKHMPQNMVNDTITHVTLDTINGVVLRSITNHMLLCTVSCKDN